MTSRPRRSGGAPEAAVLVTRRAVEVERLSNGRYLIDGETGGGRFIENGDELLIGDKRVEVRSVRQRGRSWALIGRPRAWVPK